MNNNNCLKNTLKFIYFLEHNNKNNYYNTRIVTIYDKSNNIFKSTYKYNNKIYSTNLLKIEKINNNIILFSLIHKTNNKYIHTNNYITININLICAIKCLQDINLIYERRL